MHPRQQSRTLIARRNVLCFVLGHRWGEWNTWRTDGWPGQQRNCTRWHCSRRQTTYRYPD